MTTRADMVRHFETDVLVVGGGGAGMFAALAAARNGAEVVLIDKNVVGRGGRSGPLLVWTRRIIDQFATIGE